MKKTYWEKTGISREKFYEAVREAEDDIEAERYISVKELRARLDERFSTKDQGREVCATRL